MKLMLLHFIGALAVASCFAMRQSHAILIIDTVSVGNPGNPGDPQTGGPFGAVATAYSIGRYEVTNNEYAAFLNAVGKVSDPNGLWEPNMGAGPAVIGGITRSGIVGNFSYAVASDMGNKPVNYVTWYDAMRFVNWLHNGQPIGLQISGTTEDGAYTFTGPSAVGSRNPGAIWYLPTENQWYKAAYYDPSRGGTDPYWNYPTKSDSLPTVAGAIDAMGPMRGDVSNPGANVANYTLGADWNGRNGNVTTVGSAGSPSFYLTYDQGGNIHEWTETIDSATGRAIMRGGSWFDVSNSMLVSVRQIVGPGSVSTGFGFRVATSVSAVPESSPVLLLSAAAIVALALRRWLTVDAA